MKALQTRIVMFNYCNGKYNCLAISGGERDQERERDDIMTYGKAAQLDLKPARLMCQTRLKCFMTPLLSPQFTCNGSTWRSLHPDVCQVKPSAQEPSLQNSDDAGNWLF